MGFVSVLLHVFALSYLLFSIDTIYIKYYILRPTNIRSKSRISCFLLLRRGGREGPRKDCFLPYQSLSVLFSSPAVHSTVSLSLSTTKVCLFYFAYSSSHPTSRSSALLHHHNFTEPTTLNSWTYFYPRFMRNNRSAVPFHLAVGSFPAPRHHRRISFIIKSSVAKCDARSRFALK